LFGLLQTCARFRAALTLVAAPTATPLSARSIRWGEPDFYD
jgi:hypothetical protein